MPKDGHQLSPTRHRVRRQGNGGSFMKGICARVMDTGIRQRAGMGGCSHCKKDIFPIARLKVRVEGRC
jgi:hypothetical protein